MIKYLGSKRKLIPQLLDVFGTSAQTNKRRRVIFDVFSGTARVGHAAKKAGFHVISNDLSTYGKVLADTYVVANKQDWFAPVTDELQRLQSLAPKPGYLTQAYCHDSRFFHPDNGAKMDAIWEDILSKNHTPLMRSILLTSLIEAADRVDSTCGVQMAYLKKWAKRAMNPLELRVPDMLESPLQHCSLQGDAQETIQSVEADISYLDPPYNQHSYLGNYHIWETIATGDKPERYGVAQKRIDIKERKSIFNSKPRFKDAFAKVIQAAPGMQVIVSFNNEGYLSTEEMEALLKDKGHVTRHDIDYKRYVGAQIGIHNPDGEKVGAVSHLKNKEHIFVVDVKHPIRVPESPVSHRPGVSHAH